MYLRSERYCEDLKNASREVVSKESLLGTGVLVTGATGLIGSFLVDVLLYMNRYENAEIEIYALARNEEKLKERFLSNNKNPKLHFVVQDVIYPVQISGKLDYIIHAAGDGYPAAFREHPVETMTPALFGTYELLKFAKEHSVKKLLYVSSGEIYGKAIGKECAFTEDSVGMVKSMEVRSCYPIAKQCAETMCASFFAEYGVPTVVTRLSHIYGACTSDKDNRATKQFLYNAVNGENIVLHSKGNQLRSYTYVADGVSGILSVLINGIAGEAYNVANPCSRVTIAKFSEILAGTAHTECVFEVPDEMAQKELTPIEYAVLSSEKLEKLGWRGTYSIQQGIQNMFEIGNLIWKQKRF